MPYIKLGVSPDFVQFGAGRSGSTLVFNYLKYLLAPKPILKAHTLTGLNLSNSIVFVTVRHPLDCLTSWLMKDKLSPNIQNITSVLASLRRLGLVETKQLVSTCSPNHVILRYETFYNNHMYIVKAIEDALSLRFSPDKIDVALSSFSVSNVNEYQKKFQSFKEYCKDTQIHGNHISSFKGKPFSYLNFLSTDQILYSESILYKEILALGYSLNSLS